jgi:hypothetical protein
LNDGHDKVKEIVPPKIPHYPGGSGIVGCDAPYPQNDKKDPQTKLEKEI